MIVLSLRSCRSRCVPSSMLTALLFVLSVTTGSRLFAQNVTTEAYSNARLGVQSHETVLTPANVNASTFGKVFSLPVDGHVYAEPLYVQNLTMNDGTVHNVLFVATERDYLYAFDADGKNPAQGYLWRTWLVGSGETWVLPADVGTGNVYPDLGITGTPVIDPATKTLYVDAFSKTTDSSTFFHRLHAINLADGSETMNGPTAISAAVAGTGDGGQSISFVPKLQLQRAGLTLAATPQGTSPASIFIAFASHGDLGLYHGWVISYSASDISQQTGAWNTTPNGNKGGIWMPGGALSSDDNGSVFAAIGNGTFDGDQSGGDYGDSVVSLSVQNSAMALNSYFAPADEASLETRDRDMGTGDVMLLPTQPGPLPNLAVTNDKSGTVYLLNRDQLGGFLSTTDASLQSFPLGETVLGGGAFFNNNLYWAGQAGPLSNWAFNPATPAFATTPTTTSTMTFGCQWCGGAGTTPSISANGTADAIVWALDNSARENGPAILHAFDATNLAQELYSSAQATNSRDTAAWAIKFTSPVIANGRVYVPGINAVTVYASIAALPGVTLAANPPKIAPGGSSTLTVTAKNATTITLTGDDGSSYPMTATGGTVAVSPAATTTYTATANGPAGSISATASLVVTTNTTGCFPAAAGVLICSPVISSTSPSPITLNAGAVAAKGNIVSMRAYIDNIAVITVTNPKPAPSFETTQSLTVAPGSHHLTVVAYQNVGGSVQASSSFIIGAVTPPPPTGCLPTTAGARICSPAANTSVTSPIQLQAGVLSSTGNITSIHVYVDNIKVASITNPAKTKSFSINQPLPLAKGKRRITVVGYFSTGGAVNATEYVTAQ